MKYTKDAQNSSSDDTNGNTRLEMCKDDLILSWVYTRLFALSDSSLLLTSFLAVHGYTCKMTIMQLP